MAELLSQAEIDTLLHGVDSGAVDTEPAAARGEARPYNLAARDRIVRGRLPTLEMIDERFSRLFHASLFGLLQRSPELSSYGIKMQKFGEYVESLYVPASLNLIRVTPLHGTALVMLEPGLVFALVDTYFGGGGRFHSKIEGREFTATETRVVQLLLKLAFADLHEAWSPVMKLQFEHLQSEINPHFANIVAPSEVVVVSRFGIMFDGHGGEFHIALPYSMIEPIRDQLDTGVQSDRGDRDEHWSHALREQIDDIEVDVFSVLATPTMTLKEIVGLAPGDIIPIDLPDEIKLHADHIPIASGRLGISNGNVAIKIAHLLRHTRKPPSGEPSHDEKNQIQRS